MGLSHQQKIAANALGRGLTRQQAALAAGVSLRTVANWRHIPEFCEACQQAQEEIGEPSALDTLREAQSATRRDGSPDWPTRVSAAKALLTAPADLPDAKPDAVPDGAIVVYREGLDLLEETA